MNVTARTHASGLFKWFWLKNKVTLDRLFTLFGRICWHSPAVQRRMSVRVVWPNRRVCVQIRYRCLVDWVVWWRHRTNFHPMSHQTRHRLSHSIHPRRWTDRWCQILALQKFQWVKSCRKRNFFEMLTVFISWITLQECASNGEFFVASNDFNIKVWRALETFGGILFSLWVKWVIDIQWDDDSVKEISVNSMLICIPNLFLILFIALLFGEFNFSAICLDSETLELSWNWSLVIGSFLLDFILQVLKNGSIGCHKTKKLRLESVRIHSFSQFGLISNWTYHWCSSS